MANKGTGTNRSQFFICYERQPHLNGVHTVFARVIDGWDTLDQMERLQVGPRNRPLVPPSIKGITIHANPLGEENIVYMTKDGPPDRVA
mmetsp:Transcript_3634/g.7518  ORF Transcript_3634/g.7518 Transcript_3634/m.7518 type:complete len:89 (+) Transcript_3634:412-678(+)